MNSIGWLIALAILALVVGMLLLLGGRGLRHRRGLGAGRTVALVNVTLTSLRLGLSGRPDRLIREGGMVIPEEWKSSRCVWPNHRAQMGVYFLLPARHAGALRADSALAGTDLCSGSDFDRLKDSAPGSCSQRADETVYLFCLVLAKTIV